MNSSIASTAVAALADEVLTLLIDKYEAPAETTADTEFELLGFDSLVLVEVAVALSGRFGVEVGEDELAEAGTAGGTAELLAAKGVGV